MSFLLKCPNCGERSVYEFRFGGEVRQRPAPDAAADAFLAYVLTKRNTAGLQVEWWYHRAGCGEWFKAHRNTLTNEVQQTMLPQDQEQPG
jgi:heterotetrameric sarcosine oxidase delta subunit